MIELAIENHEGITSGDHQDATEIKNKNTYPKYQEQQQIPTVSLVAMLGITQHQTFRVKSEVIGSILVTLIIYTTLVTL